ncbi:MAG TPA: hypothetical protein ENN41_05305 [Sediminispirochaeta sp.]|nr:hypothetical protein [Sediminispirochaeta sp.]
MTSYFVDTFVVLLPLFVVIAGGWLMGAFFSVDEETLTRILTDFFMPLLVLVSLYRSDLQLADMRDLLGTVVFMVAALLLLAFAYCRIRGADLRALGMPVVFMNSGFLGIPLMQLWSGDEAMNIIIVFDQFQTIFIFTLGFFIVGGGFRLRGLKLSLLSPILWALALGFAARLSGLTLPPVIVETAGFAGNAAAPLAAFVVGVSLSANRPKIDAHVLWGIALRMIGGFCIAWLATIIFDLEGLYKTVVIVAASLPAAVFSYVLPARYGVQAQDPQSIVLLSTALSVFTIPLSFVLASMV